MVFSIAVPHPIYAKMDNQPAATAQCNVCHATVMDSAQYAHTQWHQKLVSEMNAVFASDHGEYLHLRAELQSLKAIVEQQAPTIDKLSKKPSESNANGPAKKKRGVQPETQHEAGTRTGYYTFSPKSGRRLLNNVTCPECGSEEELRAVVNWETNTHVCTKTGGVVHLCMECGKVVPYVSEYQQLYITDAGPVLWVGHRECVEDPNNPPRMTDARV